MNIRTLFVRALTVTGCAALCAGAVMGASLTSPASVAEYVPFTVTIDGVGAPLCDGATANVVGQARIAGSVADIAMPPVGTRCAARTVSVPGLPRSVNRVRVTLSEIALNPGQQGTKAVPSQVLEVALEVRPLAGVGDLARFWTAEYRDALAPSTVKLMLTTTRFERFTGEWLWFEVGDPQTEAYTFKALSAPTGSAALPAPLARLYSVEYPAPLAGAFYTVDAGLARSLATAWSRVAGEMPYAVGKLDAGACPMGMTPVLQLFNPSAILHRWTQSTDTYRVLIAGGYVGEGPAWCAPNRD